MFEQSGIRGVIINSRISEVFRKKVFCLQKAVKKASDRGGRQLNALHSKLETSPRYRFNIISISISYSFVFFFREFAFLTGVFVEYSLQNHFVFFYFPLWPVRHFKNSQRRACALRGVSGRAHLQPRKNKCSSRWVKSLI